MSLVKLARRNRTDNAGSLGAVQRSIGYLQGGYKDATIHSRIQSFNTITQVGSIIYDTGYQRNYRPGISGAFSGYFSINDTIAYNKFNYLTASAALAPFTTLQHPSVSGCDFGIYSEAWLLTSTVASWDAVTPVSNWNKINLSTDSLTNYGVISTGPLGTTRQGASTGIASIFTNPNTVQLTSFKFADRSVTTIAGNAALGSGQQIPCGMSVDNNKVYFVGYIGKNVKITLSGSTILAQAVSTSYTYNFGESHSVTSSSAGYMMAGYADTTGRYGNTQHGLCQKIAFATESITTLPDLVLPQSSGQMMQGF